MLKQKTFCLLHQLKCYCSGKKIQDGTKYAEYATIIRGKSPLGTKNSHITPPNTPYFKIMEILKGDAAAFALFMMCHHIFTSVVLIPNRGGC